VVVAGAELFTSNVAYMTVAAWERKADLWGWLRVVAGSWAFNFLGALLLVQLMVWAQVRRCSCGCSCPGCWRHPFARALRGWPPVAWTALPFASLRLASPQIFAGKEAFVMELAHKKTSADFGTTLARGARPGPGLPPARPAEWRPGPRQPEPPPTHPPTHPDPCAGVLCNWLVCLGIWAANAAHDVAGKAVAIFLPVTAFVALGTEHW
jgi:hypothetical protein